MGARPPSSARTEPPGPPPSRPPQKTRVRPSSVTHAGRARQAGVQNGHRQGSNGKVNSDSKKSRERPVFDLPDEMKAKTLPKALARTAPARRANPRPRGLGVAHGP